MRDALTIRRAGREYVVGAGATPDGWDVWQAYAGGGGSWEPWLEGVLAEHLDGGTSLVDVGAWIGLVALPASRIAGHVYAVEPDPHAAQWLLENLLLSGAENVTPVLGMVGAADGVGLVAAPAGRGWGTSETSALAEGPSIMVASWTLPTLFAELELEVGDCGLLKLDVEGLEAYVLREQSTRRFLARQEFPLLVEMHAPAFAEADRDWYMAAMRRALARYRCLYVCGPSGPEPVGAGALPRTVANVLAVP